MIECNRNPEANPWLQHSLKASLTFTRSMCMCVVEDRCQNQNRLSYSFWHQIRRTSLALVIPTVVESIIRDGLIPPKHFSIGGQRPKLRYQKVYESGDTKDISKYRTKLSRILIVTSFWRFRRPNEEFKSQSELIPLLHKILKESFE